MIHSTANPPTRTLIELAEFRGFFFGEGCLDLKSPGRGRSLSPRARIALRSDDVDVLYWIQGMFGGSVAKNRDAYVWEISGVARVSSLLDVLAQGHLPSKKRRELDIMYRAIRMMPSRGQHITDSQLGLLLACRDELQSLRRREEFVIGT